MPESPHVQYDIAIVGGGIAGACAAHLLVRSGYRVALIDQRETYPNCFKAEKIEPDQVALLRKFDLFQYVLPVAEGIREILVIRDGRVSEEIAIEQYGIAYHDLVNSIRSHFPKNVDLKIGRVVGMLRARGISTLNLQDGTRVHARLTLLAAGTAGALYRELGIQRTTVRDEHSLCFGFTIATRNKHPFTFDSITMYPRNAQAAKIGYITLFKTRAGMRVNFFTYWRAKEKQVRAFIDQPIEELRTLFPELEQHIGPFELSGKVEACPIDLFVSEDPRLEGVVLAADSFQSVCPTTGMGLSKVLTDIDLLCHCFIPRWLAQQNVGPENISEFYVHDAKRSVDLLSLRSAYRQRELGSSDAMRWRLRRLLISLRSSLRRALPKLLASVKALIWRCEASAVRPRAEKA